jgi:hypothetical protein
VIAHLRGIRYYDLGGIDPQTRAGAYHFKKGLRGIDLWAPGPFESAPSALKAAFTHGAEDLYRHLGLARRSRPSSPKPGVAATLRRATAGDVEKLITICRGSFPDTLRWQVGGTPARRWWAAALPSTACETWVSVSDDDVQGVVVLVTDEQKWAAERRAARGSRRQWLAALLRRPWKAGAVVRRFLRRRATAATAGAPQRVAHTPPQDRTWVEMFAVAARPDEPGVAAGLLRQVESRTRELDRHAVQVTVRPADRPALRRYARCGFGLVHRSRRALILAKRLGRTETKAPRP